MSSLFDDSFLADLKAPRGHEEESPPPPEDDHLPEPVPDDLFGGKFDAPRTGTPTTATAPRARRSTPPHSWTG